MNIRQLMNEKMKLAQTKGEVISFLCRHGEVEDVTEVQPQELRDGAFLDSYSTDRMYSMPVVVSNGGLNRVDMDDMKYLGSIYRFTGFADDGDSCWQMIKNPEFKTPYELIDEGVLSEFDILQFRDCLGKRLNGLDTFSDEVYDSNGIFFVGQAPSDFIEDIDDETMEAFGYSDDDEDEDEEDDEEMEEHFHSGELTIVPMSSLMAYMQRYSKMIVNGAKLIDFNKTEAAE